MSHLTSEWKLTCGMTRRLKCETRHDSSKCDMVISHVTWLVVMWHDRVTSWRVISQVWHRLCSNNVIYIYTYTHIYVHMCIHIHIYIYSVSYLTESHVKSCDMWHESVISDRVWESQSCRVIWHVSHVQSCNMWHESVISDSLVMSRHLTCEMTWECDILTRECDMRVWYTWECDMRVWECDIWHESVILEYDDEFCIEIWRESNPRGSKPRSHTVSDLNHSANLVYHLWWGHSVPIVEHGWPSG